MRVPAILSVALFSLIFSAALPAADQPPKAIPVEAAPPVVPAPAFLDVVTFKVQFEGDRRTLNVISGGNLLRVDVPDESYSVIYKVDNDSYIGLEHRNDTYWTFSWPEVRDQVQSTKRYESRLRDLGTEGLSTYAESLNTNAPAPADTDNIPSTSSSAGPDNSGYVWRSTPEKKRIADFDCTRWEGQSLSGETVEAWCATGVIPQVKSALDRLRAINEPMALVPIRSLVPPIIFPVYDAMGKGGMTPILITWGEASNNNSFALVNMKTRDGKMSLFEIPKVYIKTTLITMDGITAPAQPPAPPPQTPVEREKMPQH